MLHDWNASRDCISLVGEQEFTLTLSLRERGYSRSRGAPTKLIQVHASMCP